MTEQTKAEAGAKLAEETRLERALAIARLCAKRRPESYYAEPFQPHEWVIDAVAMALETVDLLGDLMQDNVAAMQAACIENWHGKGADAAMEWIENTLDGPGLLPEESDPWGTEAQAWFDANRAKPFPPCACGRPSNIYSKYGGACSHEHYAAAESHARALIGASEVQS